MLQHVPLRMCIAVAIGQETHARVTSMRRSLTRRCSSCRAAASDRRPCCSTPCSARTESSPLRPTTFGARLNSFARRERSLSLMRSSRDSAGPATVCGRFQRYGVVPDIVTLGKPMGNGHPVAAVIAKPHIVQRFAEQARYFNTFGGNPVSCAAATAVLDVMEHEQLQRSASAVGAYLKAELKKLQQRHEVIGDIRGHGLFIGLELVRNRTTLEPAAEEATKLVKGLCDEGVLTGITGRHQNVLKLRPPMVFNQQHAAQLIDALNTVLQSI